MSAALAAATTVSMRLPCHWYALVSSERAPVAVAHQFNVELNG
ncbi:MAG: hypothetical protein QOI70_512 [Microbacteriaceae bacterium]|jgi:hypothetical protein|nr:hypothetical protein [Microbacteriaceae bacterium]